MSREQCREVIVGLSYMVFLLCIVFILTVLVYTVDVGTIDANGNLSRLLP